MGMAGDCGWRTLGQVIDRGSAFPRKLEENWTRRSHSPHDALRWGGRLRQCRGMARAHTILIAGPTASGKSALAIELALRHGGTVINADSMQVYRDLRVLTARPTPADEARVPHALFGHVDGADAYSTGRWVEDARAAISAAHAAGRTAIVVGGTGLYFKALTEGLAPIPPIPAATRAHWRREVLRLGAGPAHALLARRDPETARRLEPTDSQRIARALEVLDATGRSLAAWQQEPARPVVDAEAAERIVLLPPRAELHRRCDARFVAMVDAGARARRSPARAPSRWRARPHRGDRRGTARDSPVCEAARDLAQSQYEFLEADVCAIKLRIVQRYLTIN